LTAYLQCPDCGEKIKARERYCGRCGRDTLTLIDPSHKRLNRFNTAGSHTAFRKKIMVKIIFFILLAGIGLGGIYIWVNNKGPLTAINTGADPAQHQAEAVFEPAPELRQAATYLPVESLQLSFKQYNPEGVSGQIKRISTHLVPGAVTELELMQEDGRIFGYAYHYFTCTDGIYLVYDQIPEENIPLLKNDLKPGMSWEYRHEGVKTVWTVLALGQNVDLGFISLDNCLLVEENCDAVDYCKTIYYAPGIGRILEKVSSADQTLMQITALGSIDPQLAVEETRKWAPNYQEIKKPEH